MGTFALSGFVPFLVDFQKALVRRNLSVSERRTFLCRNRENQDTKSKSCVQTWFNLNHFSEEQM